MFWHYQELDYLGKCCDRKGGTFLFIYTEHIPAFRIRVEARQGILRILLTWWTRNKVNFIYRWILRFDFDIMSFDQGDDTNSWLFLDTCQ